MFCPFIYWKHGQNMFCSFVTLKTWSILILRAYFQSSLDLGWSGARCMPHSLVFVWLGLFCLLVEWVWRNLCLFRLHGMSVELPVLCNWVIGVEWHIRQCFVVVGKCSNVWAFVKIYNAMKKLSNRWVECNKLYWARTCSIYVSLNKRNLVGNDLLARLWQGVIPVLTFEVFTDLHGEVI
jgi:hypothetical protein